MGTVLVVLLTAAAAVSTGLVAGLFFAFSVAVMPALAKIPHPAGIRAMQAINVVIVRPVFLVVFLGAAVLTAVLAVLDPSPGNLGAAVCYLGGVIAVTAAVNVPMNNALDRVAAESPEGERGWAHYLSRWTAWNHVRTVTSTGATLALVLAG